MSLARYVPPAVALVLAVHCGGSKANDYSAADQDQAVAAISGAWATDDGTTCLELTEDATSAPPSSTCATWLVRSGGRGTRLREGGGCGGCPEDMLGLFTAKLVVQTKSTAMRAEVTFGTENAPFQRPWDVQLTAGPSTDAYGHATLDKDGTMKLVTSPSLAAGDAGATSQPTYSLHFKGKGSTCTKP